jgi:membrane protein
MPWKVFFKRLVHHWRRDALDEVAAALTFFGVMALFPFLLFLVALAGQLLTPETTTALIQEASRVIPSDATRLLSDRLHALQSGQKGGLLTVGALGAIWAAGSGVVSLSVALNRAYDVRETRPWWKLRGIGIIATLVAGLFGLLAGGVALVVPALAHGIGGSLGSAIDWLRLPVAGFLMMLVWALLYWFLPNVRVPFKIFTPGSIIGVAGWLLASWGFSVYVRNFGHYEIIYGAVGGVIVLLVWMWVSSQVLLLGAEINKVLGLAERAAHAKGRAVRAARSVGASGPAAFARSPSSLPRRVRPSRRKRWAGLLLGWLWNRLRESVRLPASHLRPR